MTSRMEVDTAREFYNEFEGEGPSYEEIVHIDDYDYVQVYRKMPVTFGFEIEQKTADLPDGLRQAYEFHQDLSGPCETALPPSTYPGRALREFVETCQETGLWEWKSQIPSGFAYPRGELAGCGSHIHFRPRFEDVEMIREKDPMIPWTCAYNTLIETVIFLLPMFCWGTNGVFRLRNSAIVPWAEFNRRRLSPTSIRRQFMNESYDGHPYEQVAFNRKPPTSVDQCPGYRGPPSSEHPISIPKRKPLTLELRLVETHPAICYELGIILNRIIRNCYARGFDSPKLNTRTRAKTFNEVRRRTLRSIDERRDFYDELHMIEDIEFQPGKGIPLLKNKYDRYLDLFDDILKKYGHSYPPMARICRLFLNRGSPFLNKHAIWRTFVPLGEFQWDEDNIPSQ